MVNHSNPTIQKLWKSVFLPTQSGSFLGRAEGMSSYPGCYDLCGDIEEARSIIRKYERGIQDVTPEELRAARDMLNNYRPNPVMLGSVSRRLGFF